MGENNNKDCAYDGGDCCAKSVKGGQVKKNYCKECKCIDPKNQGGKQPVCALPKYKGDGKCDDADNQSKGKLTCKLPNYKGDGNCDDENNNKGCGYDGGDCCAKTVTGGQVKTKYCKECKCIDPAGNN